MKRLLTPREMQQSLDYLIKTKGEDAPATVKMRKMMQIQREQLDGTWVDRSGGRKIPKPLRGQRNRRSKDYPI